ncbi:hypothetical protein CesoFtcFv8_026038 [Champsocephalus esox]|uniref:Uncharacterized protein n=1 Tax=Champsocephalus esox TaxID=159716 RepID=A0AAN8B1I5_9TELE|nr:hypothetical protein CesoFtcFv8_026038 [Champsocephalus esox]
MERWYQQHALSLLILCAASEIGHIFSNGTMRPAAADLWTNSGELSWSLGIMGTKVVMVHLAAFYCGNHQLSLPFHSFFFL